MHFSTYTTASVLAALATAQTFTDCNPMEKKCPNNPAMPQTWETDFTAGKDAIKGWKQTAGSLAYVPEGAEFTVAKKGDAPTIGSEAFLHFGYVEVVMKAAPGVGIISSIVLQSDNLDEVDWEWIGGVDSRVQQNYFGKGNTTTYDRMIEADAANNQNEFHKYALNWTAESLTWIVDDKPTRTLNFADANGGKNYPQTPCNVRLGNWPGGDSKDEGTRQWAGGNVTYEDAPFTMTVKSIKVINYSPGKEYEWTDKTGDFKSIKVIEAGNAEGAPVNSVAIEDSAAATGAPIESAIDAPAATGEAGSGSNISTTCTGSEHPRATPAPTGGAAAPQKSGSPDSPSGDSPSGSDNGDEPCECGTATVTVTGAPPAITDAPPATFSTEYSAILPSDVASSVAETPLASTAQTPIVTSAAPSSPPYPTESGLEIDTRSAPGVIAPSAPTGALPQPSGNATFSAPPAEFTGAASHIKASGLVAAVVGAVFLAL